MWFPYSVWPRGADGGAGTGMARVCPGEGLVPVGPGGPGGDEGGGSVDPDDRAVHAGGQRGFVLAADAPGLAADLGPAAHLRGGLEHERILSDQAVDIRQAVRRSLVELPQGNGPDEEDHRQGDQAEDERLEPE